MNEERSLDFSKSLERLILFRLATQEARRLHLDIDPSTKRKIDGILYRAYLDKTLANTKRTLDPTLSELKKTYKMKPLIRIRHLMLLAKDAAQRAAARVALAQIKRGLSRGEQFRALVVRFSQDSNASLGGDLGFRGHASLPKPLYESALNLVVNSISEPIYFQGGFHIIQLLDIKSFNRAEASYLAHLRGEMKKERESVLLLSALIDIRQTSKVEIFKENLTP